MNIRTREHIQSLHNYHLILKVSTGSLQLAVFALLAHFDSCWQYGSCKWLDLCCGKTEDRGKKTSNCRGQNWISLDFLKVIFTWGLMRNSTIVKGPEVEMCNCHSLVIFSPFLCNLWKSNIFTRKTFLIWIKQKKKVLFWKQLNS